MTLCLVQLINTVFDDYFVLGACKLAQILIEQERAKKSTIKLAIFPTTFFGNLSAYAMALLNVFVGAFLIIYFSTVLVSLWRMRRVKHRDKLEKYVQTVRAYFYLFGTVLVNAIILVVFVYVGLRDKEENDERIKAYDQFKFDFGKIAKELTTTGLSQSEIELISDGSVLDVRRSVAKLKLFIYSSTFSLCLAILNLVLSSIFIVIFLVIDICR